MLVEDKKEEITIEKAYDNYEDYGVAYEPERKTSSSIEEDILEEIRMDDKIEDEEIVDGVTTEEVEEKIEDVLEEITVKDEIPTRSEKKRENKVDDDFFQLIDSMYKERVDD